jgi:signal recognition particle GTPase
VHSQYFKNIFSFSPSLTTSTSLTKATENECMDSNNEELVKKTIKDYVTKESFLSMIDNVSEGGDLLKIINLLPNSSQRYGHSLTMNAILKILCHHPNFKDS